MRVIIIAVILIVVMVVLILIFTKGAGRYSEGLRDCKSKGGYCASSDYKDDLTGGPCKENEAPVPGICDEGKVCCIPIG